ncbi:MAG TPA: hypothetical protein VN933_09470 [Candidatus Eremiobacteraceae bacterium]|nr:hypothetical protein [Candidatus Eremiobacteraceae bacterium]
MTEREQNLSQIDRLTGSHVLHGSESLCKLLRYLARHVLDHPGTSIKEYQIATEVFGRSADFDPQLDSMVRVQAGRLRVKLSEYYAGDGAEDPIIVELPKGTYVLAFHHRAAVPARPAAAGNGAVAGQPAVEVAAPRGKWIFAIATLTFLLAVAAVVILSLVSNRNSAQAEMSHEVTTPPAAMKVFWNGFVSGQDEPWVIFSNAKFVGRPELGLRYYDSGKDKNTTIFDQYTGVGEVLAVHALDHLFESFHREIRVKRGSLFSLDDAKNNNLIFVGSPLENLTLLEVPGTEDFVFHRVASGARKGDPEILNVHPQPGEPKEFLGTPVGEPLTEDYAVIATVKGLEPSQAVLILAGGTTIGTQAAVEYVCNKNSVEQLLLRLSTAQTGQLKPFEAVIRVKVTRGVPVSTELVALRTTN